MLGGGDPGLWIEITLEPGNTLCVVSPLESAFLVNFSPTLLGLMSPLTFNGWSMGSGCIEFTLTTD